MQKLDLALSAAWVLPMDGQEPIVNGVVTVADGAIKAIGPKNEIDFKDAARIIDMPTGVVMPGFVNCHTHNASNMLLRGFLEDVELFEWLSTMWRLKKNFNHETLYWASLTGLIEMAKSGITAFNEHFDAYHVKPEIEALQALPLKATLGYGLADVGLYSDITNWSWNALSKFEDKINKHHKTQGGRVEVALSPHAAYSCTAEMWRAVRKLADDTGVIIHTHLAEGLNEVRYVEDNYNMTPVAWLESLGVLGPDVTAAHCTRMNADDIKMMADNQVKIAHCPICNCKLVSGTMPLKEVMESGVNVGLATDGPASHNTMDMFQEMKFAAIIHKDKTQDPKFLKTREILNMATTGAAQAMHRPQLGRLAAGLPADIIAVELNRAHALPIYDPEAALVYSSRPEDVRYTIVDGNIIVDDGKLRGLKGHNEWEVYENFRRSALDLKKRSLA